MDVNRTKEILEELKCLDLSTYPYEKAKTLIEEVFKFHAMLYIIPKGSPVLRARLNENFKNFREVSDLSYKPQKYNKTYQRASTPYKTAFYAGTLPDNTKFNDIRVIATLEVSPLVRKAMTNKNLDLTKEIQIEMLTYGKWEAIKEIPLVALCYHKNFIEKHPVTEGLYKVYTESLSKLTEEEQEISKKVNDFFAAEFAKDEISHDSDYLLSAIFTEVAISLGHAGVIYPSVRCEGEGYNIAIAPEYVNTSFRLTAVGESKLYTKNKRFLINNDSITLIKPGQKRFTCISQRGRKNFTDEKIILAYLNNEIELPIKMKN